MKTELTQPTEGFLKEGTAKKYRLYAGYYEKFISVSELAAPFVLLGEFDTLREAMRWNEKNTAADDDLYFERGIDETLDERNVFDVTAEGQVLQATNEYKKRALETK